MWKETHFRLLFEWSGMSWKLWKNLPRDRSAAGVECNIQAQERENSCAVVVTWLACDHPNMDTKNGKGGKMTMRVKKWKRWRNLARKMIKSEKKEEEKMIQGCVAHEPCRLNYYFEYGWANTTWVDLLWLFVWVCGRKWIKKEKKSKKHGIMMNLD